MKPSILQQRVFDELFHALAMCDLMRREELWAIARGLWAVEGIEGDERKLFDAVAAAIKAYADSPEQAG